VELHALNGVPVPFSLFPNLELESDGRACGVFKAFSDVWRGVTAGSLFSCNLPMLILRIGIVFLKESQNTFAIRRCGGPQLNSSGLEPRA